jgi:hypothetical protein
MDPERSSDKEPGDGDLNSGGGTSPPILWLCGFRPPGGGGLGDRDFGFSIWRNHGGGLGRRFGLLLGGLLDFSAF